MYGEFIMNYEDYEIDEYYKIKEKEHEEMADVACLVLGAALIVALGIIAAQLVWGWLN